MLESLCLLLWNPDVKELMSPKDKQTKWFGNFTAGFLFDQLSLPFSDNTKRYKKGNKCSLFRPGLSLSTLTASFRCNAIGDMYGAAWLVTGYAAVGSSVIA